MNDTKFPVVLLGTLNAGDWVRLEDGSVGMVHDKVDSAWYRKSCVEIPGARYPMRILGFDIQVEHVIDPTPAMRKNAHRIGT